MMKNKSVFSKWYFPKFIIRAFLGLSLILIPLFLHSQAYTLKDEDVVISNGSIESCSYNFSNKNIIVPSVLNEQVVSGIKSIYPKGVFEDKGITDIVLPTTLKSIGNYAFRANLLSNIIIPDSVITIGSNAFADNSLNNVTIPKSVRNIEVRAFAQNNGLTSFTLPLSEKEGHTFVQWKDSYGNPHTGNDIVSDLLTSYTAEFTINKYILSGILTGSDNVVINLIGDVTDNQTVNNGDIYSFSIEFEEDIVIIPIKDDYIFTPSEYSIKIHDNQNNLNFYAELATKIIVLDETINFNNVMVGTTTTDTLTIKNDGNSELNISSIDLPSEFNSNWTSGDILPQDSQQVIISFTPNQVKDYNENITVNSNATSGDNVFEITGRGMGGIISIPGSINFNDVVVMDSTKSDTIILKNIGNSILNIHSLDLPTDFTTNWANGNIGAGDSQIVIIHFSPSEIKTYNSQIIAHSNSIAGDSIFEVTGKGIERVISLSGNLNFNDVIVGTNSMKLLTIKNNGNRTLNISSIDLPLDFTANWTNGTILAKDSQIITIQFTPTQANVYIDTIIVNSNATKGTNSIEIICRGRGGIIFLSNDINFNDVLVNNTKTDTLVIKNTGNHSLLVNAIELPSGFSSSFKGANIPDGDSQIVFINFTPLELKTYNNNITVVSDAINNDNSMGITGRGIGSVLALSGNIEFHNVNTHNLKSDTLIIKNIGNKDLHVYSIDFPSGYSLNWENGIIAEGDSEIVIISFTPDAIKNYHDTMIIHSDATSGDSIVELTGRGMGGIISLPDMISFNGVLIDSSITDTLIIKNTGNSVLEVHSIHLPVGYSANHESGNIPVGDSLIILIRFTPSSLSFYNDVIVVNSDAVSGNNTIPVSGQGLGGIISLSGDLDFEEVIINKTSMLAFQVENKGNNVLKIEDIILPEGFYVSIKKVCSTNKYKY